MGCLPPSEGCCVTDSHRIQSPLVEVQVSSTEALRRPWWKVPRPRRGLVVLFSELELNLETPPNQEP